MTRTPALQVRSARDADIDRLVKLFDQWGHPQPGSVIATQLETWRTTASAEILVGEVDGTVVGCVGIVATPHMGRPGFCAHLVGLVVLDQFRRRHVAATLVAAAEARARRWGCDQVEIVSSRQRDAAHAFYPALGYQDQSGRQARYVRRL